MFEILDSDWLCDEVTSITTIWEKFCLWNPESWALKSKTQLKESGIPQTIGMQNQSSPEKDWDLIPVTRHPGRGIQNPKLSWIPLYGAK